MTTEVKLTLRSEVYRRAESMARRTGRSVNDFLAETLDVTLCPNGGPEDADGPISTWPDEEVLAAACSMMPPDHDRRLSELLQHQQAGTLGEGERPELLKLMRLYEEGLERKAEAIEEGVRRGIMELPKS